MRTCLGNGSSRTPSASGGARSLPRVGLGLLAATMVLTGCGTARAGGDSTEPAADGDGDGDGRPVPTELSFSARTVAGAEVDGQALAGKPAVFWFWAPWCPTCQGQVAGVGSLAEEFAGDVNVVGVGALDKPAAIEEFAARVSDEVVMLSDPEGQLWRHFGVTAQSTYLVLDETGATVASGYLDDAELAEVVAETVD